MARRPFMLAAPLCVLAVSALTGCASAAGYSTVVRSQQHKAPVSAALPVPASEHIVIIGDSLSTGFGTSPKDAWPGLLGDDLHSAQVPVEVVNAAKNGAGYIAVGDEESTFRAQISGFVNGATDVVVLFGSDNDAGHDPAELQGALADALVTIKTLAPRAKLVVIGPLTAFGALESEVKAICDQERAAARDAGAKFVDPVTEHWVPAPDSALLGPDGEHPSSQGQQFLERKIKAMLAEPEGRVA